MSKIKTQKRISNMCEISDYCHLSGPDSDLEVTEWGTCEGWDINVNTSRGEQMFSLTTGEMSLLQVLINYQAGKEQ